MTDNNKFDNEVPMPIMLLEGAVRDKTKQLESLKSKINDMMEQAERNERELGDLYSALDHLKTRGRV